jgi:hypothetical protein
MVWVVSSFARMPSIPAGQRDAVTICTGVHFQIYILKSAFTPRCFRHDSKFKLTDAVTNVLLFLIGRVLSTEVASLSQMNNQVNSRLEDLSTSIKVGLKGA